MIVTTGLVPDPRGVLRRLPGEVAPSPRYPI
jgi:hypothetical protein